MKRDKALKWIADYLGNKVMLRDDHAEALHHAGRVLDLIQDLGMKPPCVDGDKCQFLMGKYMDPSFYYWDEDFDKEHQKEYNEWAERRNKMSFREYSNEMRKITKGE